MKLELSFPENALEDIKQGGDDTTKNQLATRTISRLLDKGFDVEFFIGEWKVTRSVQRVQRSKRYRGPVQDVVVTIKTRQWVFAVYAGLTHIGDVSFIEDGDGNCGRWGYSNRELMKAIGAKEAE